MAHYLGLGQHLFVDCVVTGLATGTALLAEPSSAASSSVAAEQCAEKKVGTSKYGRLAAAVNSQFWRAVIERFGTCCDSIVGLVRMFCGERHRDTFWDGDYTFSAASRSTYAASLLVFSLVMADASMIERVVSKKARGGYTSPSSSQLPQARGHTNVARGQGSSVPLVSGDV